jgi:hypothetical protein
MQGSGLAMPAPFPLHRLDGGVNKAVNGAQDLAGVKQVVNVQLPLHRRPDPLAAGGGSFSIPLLL